MGKARTWEEHRDRGTCAGAILFFLSTTLAGVGVLAVAVWLYFNSALYMNGSEHSGTFFTAIYVIIAAGGIMAIVGFLGCCGALRESQCMLGTYFVLLLVIFTAEVTGGVWAYLNKDQTKSMIAAHVKTLVYEQYQTDKVAKETVDLLQRDLKCCGVESPADWSRVKTGAGEKLDLGIGRILGGVGVYSVPPSCCTSTDSNMCESLRKLAFAGQVFNGIYSEGCSAKLQNYIERHLTVVIGVIIGLAIAQILSLIFSIVLCCGIRDSEGVSYKA